MKITKLISILIINLFFSAIFINSVFAQSSNLSCEARAYLVDEKYPLPYKYDRVSLVNGSSTLKPGDYLIYSFHLVNSTSIKNPQIQKVNFQHIAQGQEPISIIDAKPINGNCSINQNDKSVFCTTNYSFWETADDPIYYKIKINDNIGSAPKTSSLFTVQTTAGTIECATHFWLKDQQKPNPISWSTQFAELNSSDFYIRIGDKKFYGLEPVNISSDPGNEKTTLEATWKENNVEMRMFMYFRMKDDKEWEMYDLRTYNGKNPGDWIYYKDSLGNSISSLPGYHNYHDENKFVPKNGEDAEIVCKQCSINAFLTKIIPTSTQGFILEPLIGLPQGKVITITNDPMTGYGVNVLLKDSMGNLILNQAEFSYRWTTSIQNIVQIKSGVLNVNNGCAYGIKSPCPENHVDIAGLNPGNVEIKVEVLRKIDNIVVASASFPVTVIAVGSQSPPCAAEGEVIKKDNPAKCCSDFTLFPPSDDRTDIFGACLKTCYQNTECGKDKSCQLSRTNQLICLPKSENNKDVERLKQDVKQIKQEQNIIKSTLDSVINFLKKLFGFQK